METKPYEAELIEEIHFWREYIDWWEDKYEQPATPRMINELRTANTKLAAWRAAGMDPSDGPPVYH